MIGESASSASRFAALAACPGCGRSCLQVGGEDGVGAELGLDAHGRADVGGRSRRRRSREASASMPSIPSVPLIRARPSFSCSATGVIPAAASASRGRAQFAGRVAHHALAHGRQRAVRQRGQVSRAAQRAVLVDDRGESGVEQGGVGLGGLQPHAGAAGGQGRQPQQHQRTDDLALDLRSGAGRVRADQAALQLRPGLDRDVPGGQRAEAGGDAVVRGARRPPAPRSPARLVAICCRASSASVTGASCRATATTWSMVRGPIPTTTSLMRSWHRSFGRGCQCWGRGAVWDTR